MTLKERLTEEMKQAMKAKEKGRLSAIRMVRAAIRDKEIEKRNELDDGGVLEVIANQIKKRKDAIELARQAGRDDLVESETAEVAVLEAYLPAQLTETEIEALAVQVIEEIGATSRQDMGKVMGKLIPQVRGQADNALVSQIVRNKLG